MKFVCRGVEIGTEHLVIVFDDIFQKVTGAGVQSFGTAFFFTQCSVSRFFVGGKAVDQPNLETSGGGQLFLLIGKFKVIALGGLNGGGGEQGIEAGQPFAFMTVERGSPGLLIEMFPDIRHNLRNAFGSKQSLFRINGRNLLIPDMFRRLDGIDVIHTERQDILVIDRIDDGVGVEFVSKGLFRCTEECLAASGSVFREDGCSGKTEQVVAFEGVRDVSMHVAELTAVAFVKNDDDMGIIDGMFWIFGYKV